MHTVPPMYSSSPIIRLQFTGQLPSSVSPPTTSAMALFQQRLLEDLAGRLRSQWKANKGYHDHASCMCSVCAGCSSAMANMTAAPLFSVDKVEAASLENLVSVPAAAAAEEAAVTATAATSHFVVQVKISHANNHVAERLLEALELVTYPLSDAVTVDTLGGHTLEAAGVCTYARTELVVRDESQALPLGYFLLENTGGDSVDGSVDGNKRSSGSRGGDGSAGKRIKHKLPTAITTAAAAGVTLADLTRSCAASPRSAAGTSLALETTALPNRKSPLFPWRGSGKPMHTLSSKGGRNPTKEGGRHSGGDRLSLGMGMSFDTAVHMQANPLNSNDCLVRTVEIFCVLVIMLLGELICVCCCVLICVVGDEKNRCVPRPKPDER